MTTLAVLADIHGNLPALEAVMGDMAQFKIDHVVVAGDVINWGPFSAECAEIVRREGWAVIRGNNEFYLLDYDTPREPEAWHDRSQWAMLAWLNEHMGAAWRNRIAAWPDALSLRFPDGPPIRVVHGSGRSAWDGLYVSHADEALREKLTNVDEDFVIAGHTHLPMDHRAGRWRIFNPGSVGVPLDGTFIARYMLLESKGDDWRPIFREVALDNACVFEAFEQQRFAERCGVIGRLVVEEFQTSRLRVIPFLNWRTSERPGAPFSHTLLDEFARADPWPHTPLPYHVNR
jgi:predicted phosphodiesterase